VTTLPCAGMDFDYTLIIVIIIITIITTSICIDGLDIFVFRLFKDINGNPVEILVLNFNNTLRNYI
jgi:hypothetical protein